MKIQDETMPCVGDGHSGNISFLERPGAGPAVVFLHGIGANAHAFEPVFRHMPSNFRMIAWNAPGYLTSPTLRVARPDAADYAHALERFLDAIGLEEVHLVGHSLGTLVAAAFARNAPGRVASLTLAAAAQGYGVARDAPLPGKAAKRLADLGELGVDEFARTRACGLVHEPTQHPRILARVQAEMARINPEGYAQAVHMLAQGDLARALRTCPQKPGFIIGAQDQITPMAQTEQAARAWEDAHGEPPRIVTISQAGHAVYVQAPEPFAAAVLDLNPALHDPSPTNVKGDQHDR